MIKEILNIFRKSTPVTEPDSQRLALQAENAGLILSLKELEENAKKEKLFFQKRLADEESSRQEAIDQELEKILTGLAAPLTQLLMQEHLLNAGRQVNPADIMKLVKSLESAISKFGFSVLFDAGETSTYNPDTMTKINASFGISAGEKVVIKIPGAAYKGKILRKAFVQKEDN